MGSRRTRADTKRDPEPLKMEKKDYSLDDFIYYDSYDGKWKSNTLGSSD